MVAWAGWWWGQTVVVMERGTDRSRRDLHGVAGAQGRAQVLFVPP